nr:CAP domain-containing protein [Thiococcus pfennigii]
MACVIEPGEWPAIPAWQPTLDLDASALLSAIAAARSEAEVSALDWVPALALAAYEHLAWMAEQGLLQHEGEGGSTPTSRAQAQGYPGTAGELLATGQTDAEAAVAAWMADPEAAAVLLAPDARHIGLYLAEAAPWAPFTICALVGTP